jgi:uncharacterized caspase-like protein
MAPGEARERPMRLIATFVLALAALIDVASAAPDRVALVIGNGAYRNAGALANPANDAADVAALLRNIGFDVVDGRDLDKRSMEGKIRDFSRKVDHASLVVFFYAGHGLQVGGRNYLVPVDARLERPGDLNFETIDVSLVLQQFEGDKRVSLIFLDACRDNPLSRSLARMLGTRSSTIGQGLASIQSPVGTMIAYATQPDNVALDGSGRNSPFTTALLKHMATPGLDISAVMKRVRSDVVGATQSKQVPWDHSSLLGDVMLVPANAAVTAPAPPAVAAPAATAPPAAQPPARPSAAPPSAQRGATRWTNKVLTEEPAIGKLPPGASVLVDDGTCPAGQIKEVIGGNITTGQARQRQCVPRN